MHVRLPYRKCQRFCNRTCDLYVMERLANAIHPIKISIWSLNGAALVYIYVESVSDQSIGWTNEHKASPGVNRLKDLCDFNIEVLTSKPTLRASENRFLISIKDATGQANQIEIVFTYDPTPMTLPLDPTDVSSYRHVQEVVQVVNGTIYINHDLICSRARVYPNGLLVLGSPHGNQEATNNVDFPDPSKIKWLGTSDFFAGHQGLTPPIGMKPGWSSAGMIALNPHEEGRSFLAYVDLVGTHHECVVHITPRKRFNVRKHVLYWVRHQVRLTDGIDNLRYKSWIEGTPEPNKWLIEEDASCIPNQFPKYKECTYELFQHSGMPIEWSNICGKAM